MNIFIKYLLKSAFSKKGRSLLLIVTITISTALLIGSLGAVTAGNKASKEQAKRTSGDYNVLITAKNIDEMPFFDKDKIDKTNFDSYIASINLYGYLSKDDNVNITIEGVASEDFQKLPNMRILKEENLNSLDGNKIIISEKASQNNNLKLGDIMQVKIRGVNKSFKVCAIAQTNGVFSTDLKNQFVIVTNEKYVSDILGVKGLSNLIYAKLKSNVNSNKFIKSYNEQNSKSMAALTFDEDKANADAKDVSILLYFMLLLVVIMSSFIIYSCFKLIVIDRMPVIGTFLSQGETRGGIIKLLLGESLIYGLISGILSFFLGGGLIFLLADLLNDYKKYGVATKVDYNISHFIIGFIFSIVISLISALIPILGVRKIQVKDIILNRTSSTYKKSYRVAILGIILSVTAIVINCLNKSISIRFSPITFFAFLIGAVMSLSGIAKVLSYYLMRLFQNLSVSIRLALNNIRTSKVLLNNIRLLVIGMVSIMIILSLSSSFTNTLLGMAKDFKYDISVYQGTDPAKVKSVVYKDPNITKVIETYFVTDGEVKGANLKLAIGGINPNTYKDFNNYFDISNKAEFYSILGKKERYVVINDKAAKAINKSVGDSIIIRINNKEAMYKIINIFNAKLAPNQILMNKENMAQDFGVTVPDSYNLIVNDNVNKEKKILEKELKGTSAKVMTFNEDVKAVSDDTKLLLNVLLFFSFMTVIIGVFGIINNIGVSFIQRKKDFALLSSVGMTNGGNGRMVLIESIFIGIFAAGLGGAISYFAVMMSNNLAKSIELSIPMKYNFNASYVVSAGILVIMLLSSCSVVIKSSKISVIKELKYE